MKSIGFSLYPHQKCLFRWEKHDEVAILLIYVDDCLLATSSEALATHIVDKLNSEFKMKNLGTPKKFLGFEICRNMENRTIFINQKEFILGMLDKYLPSGYGTSDLPMSPRVVTLSYQLENVGDSPDVSYREVIGSLLYLQNGTRPDISFAVNFLSRKQTNFTCLDWECVLKVLQYLKGTVHLGLLYTGVGEDIVGFTDASLGTNALNGRSTTGLVIKAFGDVVMWRSKKQTHVALSTCESEYIAMSDTCRELANIRNMCKYISNISILPTLYGDCKPAISVSKTDDSRTLKHIVKLTYHYVREEFQKGNVDIQWVKSGDQLADMLTKPLPLDKFVIFRECLLTNNIK